MGKRRSVWKDALEGFTIGYDLMGKYQNDQIEREAGDAYKAVTPTETASGSDAMANFEKNYVPQDGGPATAAEYIQQNPDSFAGLAGRKQSFEMSGKTQDKPFTDGELEAGRMRAAANVYAGAGKMKESSQMRRDAAGVARDELQGKIMQEGYDQSAAMDAAFAAKAGVGDIQDASGQKVDAEAMRIKLVASGVDPEIAAAQAQSTLDTYKAAKVGPGGPLDVKTANMADQYANAATVAKMGGAKMQGQYLDLLDKGAGEVSKQAQRDIMSAKNVGDLNSGAYGKIDNGEDLREVAGKDGRVTYERVSADGKSLGPANGGKSYGNFAEFQADMVAQLDRNPEKFVAYVQKQADQQFDRTKFAETQRHNKASEGISYGNLDEARKSGNLSREVSQRALDLDKALGVPAAERTPEQAALVGAANERAALKEKEKGRTQERQSAAVDKTTKYVRDNVNLGKGAMTGFTPEELDRNTAIVSTASAMANAMVRQPGYAGQDLNESAIEAGAKRAVARGQDLIKTGALPAGTSLADAAMAALEMDAQKKGGAPARPTNGAGAGPKDFSTLFSSKR